MRIPAAIFLCSTVVLASDSDLILYNGRIITLSGRVPTASAVAVKDGRISRVGADQDVRGVEAGPNTAQIDLQGKCVLPGLIDNHVHALSAGLSEYRGEIPSLASYADVRSEEHTSA